MMRCFFFSIASETSSYNFSLTETCNIIYVTIGDIVRISFVFFVNLLCITNPTLAMLLPMWYKICPDGLPIYFSSYFLTSEKPICPYFYPSSLPLLAVFLLFLSLCTPLFSSLVQPLYSEHPLIFRRFHCCRGEWHSIRREQMAVLCFVSSLFGRCILAFFTTLARRVSESYDNGKREKIIFICYLTTKKTLSVAL